MGWVNDARDQLAKGERAKVRPVGGSMHGRIESGQLVTIAAVSASEVSVHDVVFVEWRGNYLLHLVKEIQDGKFLIGNNLGKINGWVESSAIIGKVIAVEE